MATVGEEFCFLVPHFLFMCTLRQPGHGHWLTSCGVEGWFWRGTLFCVLPCCNTPDSMNIYITSGAYYLDWAYLQTCASACLLMHTLYLSGSVFFNYILFYFIPVNSQIKILHTSPSLALSKILCNYHGHSETVELFLDFYINFDLLIQYKKNEKKVWWVETREVK